MWKYKYPLLIIFTLQFCALFAQNKAIIYGRVINEFTKEPIPYASVSWLVTKRGVISDSLGFFTISRPYDKTDSLVVDYVGYQAKKLAYGNLKRDTNLIFLEVQKSKQEVVVKSKFSKGLRWWSNVVKNKKNNNPYNIEFYNCELYNKFELDLNNVNRNSFSNIKFLKPFSFILDNIDSVTESKPFLPFLMIESLSDYYYEKNPYNTREVVKASETHGIKNETVMQFIDGVNQKLNLYDNYIKLFNKEFISPISEFADKFYNFKGADTQYLNGNKVFHLLFTPKNEGENTFIGDTWIDEKTWGIYKMTLSVSPTADVNFVNRLSVIQEFDKLKNGQFVFSKDKIVVDLSPLPNDKLTFIVRKSISYKDYQVNHDTLANNLKLNSKKNEVVILENSSKKEAQFWNTYRHDDLNKNEQSILKMIDTLKSIPLFKEYTRNLEFLVDGYRKYGKVEIGPWYKWVSGNQLERLRLRFDLGTTEQFSKYWRLNGYLAYGIKDKSWKEYFSVAYKFPKLKGISTQISYLNDLDNGRVRFNEEDASTDNIFSQALRRPTIPQKFLGQKEIKFSITKEWNSGLSNSLSLTRTDFEPYTPLPGKNNIGDGNYKEIISTDIMYRIRYAPGEKKIVTNRRQIRFKGSKPIYELRYTEGFKGLLGSGYDYKKIHAAISQKVRVPNFGVITYNAYAGKIYGDSLPFMLLELHPGNEVYVYNRNGFNLMNRFEYFSDYYAGFQLEHNIEKKIINLIPFLRKTKIRQFWTLKGVWGQMNTANRVFNRTELGAYQLRTLRANTYLEYGTGFDNIFRFFRIDFVWRQAPSIPANTATSRIQPVQNFGIFGSVRLQF